MKILFRLFLILLLLVVFSLIVDLSEKTPELYLSKSFLYYGIPINVLYSAATLLIFGLYWVLKKKGPQNKMILDFKSKTWMQKKRCCTIIFCGDSVAAPASKLVRHKSLYALSVRMRMLWLLTLKK